MLAILLDLTRRYCEPHRHYHTIEHIATMLHRGRDLALSDEQVLAIWFHDAIYDVHSHSNEEDSARLAVAMLGAARYAEESVNAVEQMVLDTKRHEPTLEESRIVIDLDLAPLAVPWEEFVANRERLRHEYAWMSEVDFERGRREILTRLVARERIFWTPWGARLEAVARTNLRRALAPAG